MNTQLGIANINSFYLKIELDHSIWNEKAYKEYFANASGRYIMRKGLFWGYAESILLKRSGLVYGVLKCKRFVDSIDADSNMIANMQTDSFRVKVIM